MKKFFLAIMAIVVIAAMWFAPLAQAVTVNGERQVGVSSSTAAYKNPTYAARVPDASAKMLKAIKGNSARLKKLEKSTNALASEQRKMIVVQINTQSAVTTLADNVTILANETEKAAKTADKAFKHADTANKNIVAYGKAILNNGANNTWILAILIGAVIGLLIYLIFFRKDGKDDEILNKLEIVSENLSDKINVARETIPVETAKAVNEYFDPTPFTYDIEGKHVECNFSVPEDECYLTLKIESTNGSQNPADFERQVLDKHKRGLAAKYVRGTMTKFLKGGLAGTQEEALINYLVNVTKEIKIS